MSSIRADNFGNRAGTSSVPADNVLQGVKVWLNMDGTGTISIRDSFNISSITDQGVGTYRATFSIARPAVNYGVTLGCSLPGGNGGSIDMGTYTTTYVDTLSAWYGPTTIADVTTASVTVHGDPV